MNWQRKVMYMVMGGLVVLGLAFAGAATFAQTDDDVETPFQGEDGERPFFGGRGGRQGDGRPDFAGERGQKGQALADALGISLEELEAAHEEARAAAIAQAVTDGLLTQEQADAILAGEGRSRGYGRHLGGVDGKTYLADALGISVEELEAAMQQVQAERLAAMVEAGVITQEQADLMEARQAVESYVDREALQETMQAAYEDAVNQALEEGDITQEQADTLLSNAANFGGRGFGGPGFGGHGGRHHGPRGGAGFAPFQNNDQPGTANTALDA